MLVTFNLIFLSEQTEMPTTKTALKKMVSSLKDALCLFYELFIFHDKTTVGREVTKEFYEKIQKTANLHYNTILNKSFKKNKIKEICVVLTKLLENVQNLISTFLQTEQSNSIFIKIFSALLERIDDIKFTSLGNLLINSLLFCFLKKIDVDISLDDLNNINENPPYLPSMPSHLSYTVVLDLDETLIHFINVISTLI
jgi:hypothetical protein